MQSRIAAFVFATVVFALSSLGMAGAQAPERALTVFAAASLKNAIDDVGAAFQAKTGTRVVASYAATPQLMRQIEQGAPADVFISADLEWMDYGAGKKVIKEDTRFDLLGNRLVLVAPREAKVEDVLLGPYVDLAPLVGNGRIVLGDVRAVPAGRYAKAALESLGVWASVEKAVAMTENVRAALALVARGEAALGVVYATDAQIEPKVKVIGIFPEGSHPPVVYPVALTAVAKPGAQSYLDYLRTPEATAIFERHGFYAMTKPAS